VVSRSTHKEIVKARKEELREMDGLKMIPVELFFPSHAIFAVLFHLLLLATEPMWSGVLETEYF